MSKLTTPLTPLSQAQLFLDNTLIGVHFRVARRSHSARKFAEPVLRPDRPWEGRCPVLYGTVLHREGRFQMWYTSSGPAKVIQVCYAESDDGLVWRKPVLGLIEYAGSKENNICLAPEHSTYIDDVSVIADPEDKAWPLKAFFFEGAGSDEPNAGIRAARSKDGMKWDTLPGFVLPFQDRFNAMPHREDGKFVIFGRTRGGYRGSKSQYYGPDRQRLVFRTESEDLVHWSEPVFVNKPALEDPAAMRIYSQTAFHYEGRLLGFLERMNVAPDVLDPELTWSNDGGYTWLRLPGRPTFIERGPLGGWDGNWLNLSSNGPILVGGCLWFYYSGRSGAHATPYPQVGAFGMATLRRDGFVSIQGEEEPGFVQTVPLRWEGADLLVNVDNRRLETAHARHWAGWLAADIRDEQDEAVAGFAGEDCLKIDRNTEFDGKDCYRPVRWKGDRKLGELSGRTIRIRFILKDARLFAFKAGDVPD